MQFIVRSSEDLKSVYYHLGNMMHPFRVTILKGEEKRTDKMNKTIHKWFSEIAAHRGDVTMMEVKAEMNLTYGVPIKSRDDDDWRAVFGYLFRDLDHARKIKALRLLDIPITRDMTITQLGEYMDQMYRDTTEQGIYLTVKEDMKYREEAS